MIADLKPYPAMKESGREWLGGVPEHWQIRPIGGLGSLFKGNGGNKGDEVSGGVPCVRYGDLYTRHEFFITKSKACVSKERAGAYTPIRHGDVLFAASGETMEDIGRSAVNLIEGEARCGGDILVLRPQVPANPRYLGYAADSPPSRNQKASMGKGFTVVHVYGSQLKRLLLPLPPLPEQAAIVRFLDHADRRIRRHIRAKQKLIKLLEEQKQALIHRAVTRGLDPDVPLKDSGMEWLGEVPEHWEVQPIGRIGHLFKGSGGTKEDEVPGGVPCVRYGDLYTQHEFFIRGTKAYVSPERAADYTRLRRGDVLFATSGETIEDIGRSAENLIEGESCCGGDVLVFRPNVDTVAKYLGYAADCTASRHQKSCMGRGFTVVHIYGSQLKRLPLPLPPLPEQAAIVRFLDGANQDTAAALGRANREISLLRELRTRLIADVVTGKLDVREAAARLPDEEDDLDSLDDTDPLDQQEGALGGTDLDAELEEIEA